MAVPEPYPLLFATKLLVWFSFRFLDFDFVTVWTVV
jgi:hypothetical protein